ncbi:TRAP transporter small permease [Sulfitobacter porphyrae]|uniref:TRAP transporter small permease protein n=1 Tax=Sulfitobacter porphyrae TaxID=1246864 RepID=A0ABW2BAF4_9RHOB
MIRLLERGLHHAARLVAYASGGLVLVAAVVTLYEVFMRSVVNRPFFGANDLVLYVLTIGVIGFFPLMVDSGHHIKIDSFGKFLGPRWFRRFEWFGNIVTLFVLAAFVWQFWRQGMRMVLQRCHTDSATAAGTDVVCRIRDPGPGDGDTAADRSDRKH